jgi:glutamine synthetase
MSIISRGSDTPEVYESFYAGILKHLPAITAFTYSSPASYDRMVDSCWAGGRWVTWGTQNRETPLRKIEDSHWEFKCLDGIANPYLALAALLSSGLNGLLNKEELTWGDCEIDPANFTENDRTELGVDKMLPASLTEALQSLRDDAHLISWLGQELVDRYLAIKEAEIDTLSKMTNDEQKQWLMERY